VACILERHDNDLLIALPKSDKADARRWLFPRGLAQDGETPEAGMRRVCQESLGVAVEIVVGQPPLLCEVNGLEHEIRFFFCGIITGSVQSDRFRETRWVSRMHLSEYEFDAPSAPVVAWLVEKPT